MPELEAFKPSASKPDYTPVNKLEVEPKRTSFSTPLYAYRLMELYKQTRGASDRMNLSDKFRISFERYKSLEFQDRMAVISGLRRPVRFNTPTWFNHNYSPKGGRYSFNESVSLSLFPDHLGMIAEAREQSDLNHQEFLTAFFFWSEGLDQEHLKGWNTWVEFNQGDWSAGGKDPHALLDLLVEHGFAKLIEA